MEHERSSETKKILQCPQTLSLFRVGSGNETRLLLGGHKNVTRLSQSCHKVVIRWSKVVTRLHAWLSQPGSKVVATL